MIPRQKLKAALAAGARETWELAEEFGVTCEIVQLRLSLNDCQELIRSYRGQED